MLSLVFNLGNVNAFPRDNFQFIWLDHVSIMNKKTLFIFHGSLDNGLYFNNNISYVFSWELFLLYWSYKMKERRKTGEFHNDQKLIAVMFSLISHRA